MDEIKTFYDRQQAGARLSELPYGHKSAPYTVTFVLPVLNQEGFYRMILPWRAINRWIRDMKSIIIGMTMYDPEKCINDYDLVIPKSIIRQSNHIVIPFVSYDIAKLAADLRRTNSRVKISYMIDFNYMDTPDSYPFSKQYKSKESIELIDGNIQIADQVIVNNSEMYVLLDEKFETKLHEKLKIQPVLYDRTIMEHISESEDFIKAEKFRIGIIANNTHLSDINYIRGILGEIKKKHKDNIEIVIWGFDGIHRNQNYLKNLEFTYEPPVPIFDYYQRLVDLAFNLVLIPARPGKFNRTSKNYTKVLELNRFGINYICSDIHPFNFLLKHNETGILCKKKENWEYEINLAINGGEKFTELNNFASSYLLGWDINTNHGLGLIHQLFKI